MRALAVIKVRNMRGAIRVCLALALLPLRASQGEMPAESSASGTAVVAAQAADQESYREFLPEPFEQEPPMVVASDVTAGTAFADPQPRRNRLWQCVPQGMIPYVGPRTPDDRKDRGIGLPLKGRGWRSQPFAISTFAGVTDGDPMVSHHVNQQPSFYGGINFSWDYDHYWGIEKRLGFGALNLTNGNHVPIPNTGLSVTGEYRLMYYPLGDARWRPFVTAGVGWSDFYFDDDRNTTHLDTVGMVPFGFGLKYLYRERLAFRVDLIDEFTFGTGELSNFHYVALTAGVEVRYGHRLLKMPWHRHSKTDVN